MVSYKVLGTLGRGKWVHVSLVWELWLPKMFVFWALAVVTIQTVGWNKRLEHHARMIIDTLAFALSCQVVWILSLQVAVILCYFPHRWLAWMSLQLGWFDLKGTSLYEGIPKRRSVISSRSQTRVSLFVFGRSRVSRWGSLVLYSWIMKHLTKLRIDWLGTP